MTTPNQPGWYDDPHDPNAQRYWDGQDWLPQRQRKPQPPPPAMPPPAMPPPPPGGYAAGPSAEPPPPAWPAPFAGGSGQAPAVNFDAIQGMVKQFGLTAWLIAGGSIALIISMFLPWFALNVEGMTLMSVSPSAYWTFGSILLVALIGWLAWPFLAGNPLPVPRLIGLTVEVAALGLVIIANWPSGVDDDSGISPGFGVLLFGAAVIAIAAGVVRLWMAQSKTQGPPR